MIEDTKKYDLKNYSSLEEYKYFFEAYKRVTTILIFSIHRHEITTKKIIIRNFMAKSTVSLQGIFSLWSIKNYQDCYVILRIITDRLFHLYDLVKNNRFEAFDNWSFYQQFCSRNRIRSDKEYNHKIVKEAFDASEEEKQRFFELQKMKPTYKRPHPEKMAKELGVSFVYKYGYDHASTLVHPMANDGWEDLIHLTGLYPDTELPDHRSVISNSLLCHHLLHNNALQGLGFTWRKEVISFMDDAMDFLKTGSKNYQKSFLSIASLQGKNTVFCKNEDGKV